MEISRLGYQSLSHLPKNTVQNERLAAAFEATMQGKGTLEPLFAGKVSDPANISQTDSPPSFKSRYSIANVAMNLGVKDGAIHMEDLEALANIAAENLQDELRQAFMANGIALYPSATFTTDFEGHVVVNNHPDKAKIEQLLKDTPQLAQDMHDTMALQSQAAEFKQYSVFLTHYYSAYNSGGAKAANAVTERYLGMNKPDFSFTFGLDGFKLLADGLSVEAWLAKTEQQLGD